MSKSPTFNVCIYCDATGANLTDEHAIPKGLGGTAVLKKASCPACSKITSSFESRCLKTYFYMARAALKLPTRRKQSRKRGLPVKVLLADGTKTIVQIPPDKVPFTIAIPQLSTAKFLLNEPYFPKGNGKVEAKSIWYKSIPEDFFRNLYPDMDIVESVYEGFRVDDLVRLHAKIAYCMALYDHGYDNIKPFLRPLILGKEILGQKVDLNYFVGSHMSDEKDKLIHRAVVSIKKDRSIVVSLRLFSFFGGPVFDVLVGQISDLPPQGHREFHLKFKPHGSGG